MKPDTLLRWHRQGFKLFWRFKFKPKTPKPRIGEETIALIIQMAKEDPLWGAERIRGELLKLDISVSKRTVRKYLHRVRSRPRTDQTWCTFLRNHSTQTWACDWFFGCTEFRPVADFFFGQLYAFFIMELGSRRIVHFGVTRHPTDQWVAQQLREATPFDEKPKYLIRDNDGKYGTAFARVATGTSIQVLKTPIRAPKANAMCERLMGSIRGECLDHFLILNERHLYKVLKAYTNYYNRQRPHQGIEQGLPVAEPHVTTSDTNEQWEAGNIVAIPVLGGLHHNYERAA